MQLYETHLPVADLPRAIDFYQNVVGLELAYEVKKRSVAFLWIGSREQSMLGLWGPEALYGWKGDQRFRCHFAMSVPLAELLEWPAKLQAAGVRPYGFDGITSDEPSVIGWMPSAQIYFRDPDDHTVEFITILNDPPDPTYIGSWTEWNQRFRQA